MSMQHLHQFVVALEREMRRLPELERAVDATLASVDDSELRACLAALYDWIADHPNEEPPPDVRLPRVIEVLLALVVPTEGTYADVLAGALVYLEALAALRQSRGAPTRARQLRRAFALGAGTMLRFGVPMFVLLPAVAHDLGDADYTQLTKRLSERVVDGRPLLSAAVEAERLLGPDVVGAFERGEVTGRLASELLAAARAVGRRGTLQG